MTIQNIIKDYKGNIVDGKGSVIISDEIGVKLYSIAAGKSGSFAKGTDILVLSGLLKVNGSVCHRNALLKVGDESVSYLCLDACTYLTIVLNKIKRKAKKSNYTYVEEKGV